MTLNQSTFNVEWSNCFAYSVGGLVGAVCTSPLDVVKTRLQVNEKLGSFSLSLALTAHSPLSLVYFLQANPKHHCNNSNNQSLMGSLYRNRALVGPNQASRRSSGVFQRTRTQLGRCYSSKVQLYCQKTEWILTFLLLSGSRSINFYTYGNGKKLYTELNHNKETPIVHLVSAATAGLVTSTATNPIWVIKTRLQLQGNTRLYSNSLDCVMHIIREEGVRGLYKGMSASYLGKSIPIHSTPTKGIRGAHGWFFFRCGWRNYSMGHLWTP